MADGVEQEEPGDCLARFVRALRFGSESEPVRLSPPTYFHPDLPENYPNSCRTADMVQAEQYFTRKLPETKSPQVLIL